MNNSPIQPWYITTSGNFIKSQPVVHTSGNFIKSQVPVHTSGNFIKLPVIK